jgi:hypothetical protein
MAEVSAFLGGLFFPALLILIQAKDMFSYVLFQAKFFEITLSLNSLQVVATPLSISIVLFTFSAIRFAGASSYDSLKELNHTSRPAYTTFRLGLISMIICLCAILFFVDLFVCLLGIVSIVATVSYFLRKQK